MGTTTSIVKAEPVVSLVMSNRAVIMADALKQAGEQRELLTKYVNEQMVLDVDYGIIPGTKGKPSLYKPGAEKLTELYRCSVEYVIEKEVEDWEKGFFYYRVMARIMSRDAEGVILGVGIGSCNSRETKYRWRDSKLKCPECGSETIFKSKGEDRQGKPRTGWYCWSAKGGCGKNWERNDDPAIVDQPRGRVENPDIADLVNTIVKMATKRAHVAAALQLAGCSDLFTQDLEDLPEHLLDKEKPQGNQPAPAAEKDGGWAQREEENPFPPDGPPGPPAAQKAPPPRQPLTPAQLRTEALRIWSLKQKQGMSVEQFRAWAAKELGHTKQQPEWTEADLEKLKYEVAREASGPAR